ncbi:hypothetical protein [Flagellimonas sp.]|uniref:hypothetical protein n=1 Tax=Flagellimonas sp. TaxID=2058762 RepID=UPI000B691DBB|nr:MAG: hypothetical protein CBB72_014355 [Muricauda sp. TMED12]
MAPIGLLPSKSIGNHAIVNEVRRELDRGVTNDLISVKVVQAFYMAKNMDRKQLFLNRSVFSNSNSRLSNYSQEQYQSLF